MTAVLSVALPVFAVIAAGFIAGRMKLASADDSAALNRFVFRFAMPAALFGLMSGASGLKAEDGLIALAYGAPALAVMFGAYFLARTMLRLDAPTAGAHAFASTMGNAVFLGLPIALGLDGWGRPFVDLMLVEGILVIGVGAALMAAPEKGPRRLDLAGVLTRPLKNPLVVAALAGFAVASAGIALPGPARSFFDILGRAAGPAALFSLGLFLAARRAAILPYAPNIAAIASFKMALLPALSLALLHFLGVDDPHYRGALALFTVVPTAVSAFIMASQYGRYVEQSAAAIAVTTALSLASISAVLILFA
ncbi:MAG: AEC family transporter [Parvularculaceae bacterium]